MRIHLWFGVWAVVFLVAGSASAQQSSASQPPAASGQATSQTSPAPPAQQDSLAAAARRSREQKKDQPKPAKVITNENIPTQGGISAVGSSSTAAPGATADNAAATPAKPGSAPTDEKGWREKFANLRHKVEQDQAELDVMQRELGVLDVQYYSDPVKAMQQDLTRADINKKTADIEAKKQQIEADKQAISDAEDDLRKAGGDSGWAR